MHGHYSGKKPEQPDVKVPLSEVARPGASHMIKALKTFNPPPEVKNRLVMRVGTVMASKLTAKNAYNQSMHLGFRDKVAHRDFFINAVNAGLDDAGWKAAKASEGVVSRRDAGISSIRRRCEGDFGRREGNKLADDAHAIIQVVRAYGITEKDGLAEIIRDLVHSRGYDEVEREYIGDLVGSYLHARNREALSRKLRSAPGSRMSEDKIHDAPVSLRKAIARRKRAAKPAEKRDFVKAPTRQMRI